MENKILPFAAFAVALSLSLTSCEKENVKAKKPAVKATNTLSNLNADVSFLKSEIFAGGNAIGENYQKDLPNEEVVVAEPLGVAVGPDSSVYYVDEHLFIKKSYRGFVTTFYNAYSNEPEGVLLTRVVAGLDNNIYAVDKGLNRILKFTPQGQRSVAIQNLDILDPGEIVDDVDVAANGTMFISTRKRIIRISPQGVASVYINCITFPAGAFVQIMGIKLIAGGNLYFLYAPYGYASHASKSSTIRFKNDHSQSTNGVSTHIELGVAFDIDALDDRTIFIAGTDKISRVSRGGKVEKLPGNYNQATYIAAGKDGLYFSEIQGDGQPPYIGRIF